MFLIVYLGQRYKIKIRKTKLMTIIFGWERELEGQGEERRENWEGRQGRLRSRPTRHCLVEQRPLGTDRGQVGTEGRLAGNGSRGRWERGKGSLATACAHYQLSPKSSRQTRSLTLRNGSKYAFLRHDKTGGYNLPRSEHCNAGVL